MTTALKTRIFHVIGVDVFRKKMWSLLKTFMVSLIHVFISLSRFASLAKLLLNISFHPHVSVYVRLEILCCSCHPFLVQHTCLNLVPDYSIQILSQFPTSNCSFVLIASLLEVCGRHIRVLRNQQCRYYHFGVLDSFDECPRN